MNIPQSIKNSTELNNKEKQMTDEQFVIKFFVTTNDENDKIHLDDIKDILNEKGYKLNKHEVGRIINRIGIGKYDDRCNIDKVRKAGFKFIKYIENS